MGSIISHYRIKLSSDVLWSILTILNSATLILTATNLYSLRRGFRKLNIPQHDTERRRVIWFYYEITTVPLLVAGCGHYGAQFPKQAIWIFPGLQIFLAFNFFWFLGMMYKSAGGHDNVKWHLLRKEDRCGYPRCEHSWCCLCCLRDNQWLGTKSRLWYLYLIYVKPLWAFALSVMYRVNYPFPKYYEYTLRALVLLCTLIPLNAITCFVTAVEPISRIRRIRPKVQLIRIMVPILQIQQLTLSFCVSLGIIEDLQSVPAQYRGSRIEGTLLSFEMLIVAMATHFIYRADDLNHWTQKEDRYWHRYRQRRKGTEENGYVDLEDLKEELNADDHECVSELTVLSTVSMNANALSTLLGGHGNKDGLMQLRATPEDHSLRDRLLSNDANYQSVDDQR